MKHSETLNIPPVLTSKLEEFRSRLWAVKVGEGILAGIAGLLISFLLVFVMDRFFDTPVWVRVLILLGGFSIPAIGIPLQYNKWVWQKRSLPQISRVLRRRYPKLGDELLGIVDLARESEVKGRSQALVNAAMSHVAEKVKDKDFSGAVPENHYREWGVTCVILALLAVTAVIIVTGATQNSVARWLTPWRMVERYTFARLKPVEKEMIVPYAERFDLETQLRDNTEWAPESGSVRLPGKTKLEADLGLNKAYDFEVPPQKENASLALRVGDAREKIKIRPVVRPELNNFAAKVRLPDYLMYERDPVIPVQGGIVDLIQGATASFIGTTSRDLKRATVNGVATAISGNSFSTKPETVDRSNDYEFEWVDKHGLTAKSPFELRVNGVEDAQPDVFANKLSSEKVILIDEVVWFDINSSDDFGLREIGIEWQGVRDPVHNPEPAVGGKRVLAGGAETRELEARGTFSAERNRIKPQTVQVRAYAEDFFPNRPRIYSNAFVLHIMSPSDHANWLTNEFGKWFSRAREVYEREQQLHETNRELRDLAAAELDRPENRRKLEQQAASESSNARRLEALTSNGRDMIRQASKNREFEADRLERWAKMMRQLDDISKSRMPSVAELLKKSSRAAGASDGDHQESRADADRSSPGGGDSKSKPEKSEGGQSKGAQGGSSPSVNNQPGQGQPKNPDSASKDAQDEKQAGASAPSIKDTESTFNTEKPEPGEKQAQPKGKSALGLPQTTLMGGVEKPKDADTSEAAFSPAQASLDQALEQQSELLTQFAKVADELQEILSSLEASTFVKRLKAASRQQLEIAKNLNSVVGSGFGMAKDRVTNRLQEAASMAFQTADEESDKLYTIQSDLDAYYQRKQEKAYKNVLDQMRNSSVVTELKKVGKEADDNLNGRSISAAEYWSDTLDRWAEELVSASQSPEQQKGESKSKDKKSLPPEIVLEVMRAARDEMNLREETREVNGLKEGLSPDEYAEQVRFLEVDQSDNRERVDDVVLDILDLDNAEENFSKELQLLNYVSDIMRQARGILARPDTGPEVIAAQTEAIEMLLQARRQPPNQGGGGGGGGAPGGGSSGQDNGSALSDISLSPSGSGGREPSGSPSRQVDQSTGKAGQEFPDEFRNGLDTYFNQLEKVR